MLNIQIKKISNLFAESFTMSLDFFQFIDDRLKLLLITKHFLDYFILALLMVKRLQIHFVENVVRCEGLLNLDRDTCQLWNVVRISVL